jgi:hypothetical protein
VPAPGCWRSAGATRCLACCTKRSGHQAVRPPVAEGWGRGTRRIRLSVDPTDPVSCARVSAVPQDAGRQKRLGAFYTPPEMARVLVDWAVRDATDRVLDPSFGGLVFLEAAAARLAALGADSAAAGLQLYRGAGRARYSRPPANRSRCRDPSRRQGARSRRAGSMTAEVGRAPSVGSHRTPREAGRRSMRFSTVAGVTARLAA